MQSLQEVCIECPHLSNPLDLPHNDNIIHVVCSGLLVAKVPFTRDLSQECAILQSLQGIAGIPNLLRDQCVGDSILMRPVLAPLTDGAFFVHNLHNSLPALVQTLKVRAVCQCLAAP